MDEPIALIEKAATFLEQATEMTYAAVLMLLYQTGSLSSLVTQADDDADSSDNGSSYNDTSNEFVQTASSPHGLSSRSSADNDDADLTVFTPAHSQDPCDDAAASATSATTASPTTNSPGAQVSGTGASAANPHTASKFEFSPGLNLQGHATTRLSMLIL